MDFVEIENKYRITLEDLEVQIQAFVCEEGRKFISALTFIRSIGKLNHIYAMRVIRHHKTCDIFQYTEIGEVEIPLIPVERLSDLNRLCDHIELKKQEELRSKKCAVVGYEVNRDLAERAFLDAAKQLYRLGAKV